MPENLKSLLGKKGEKLALDYLLSHGYLLKFRNYEIKSPGKRGKIGEIDLVLVDPETEELVFTEVRTRHINDISSPLQSIDWKKQRQIIKCAKLFLAKEKVVNVYIRFDCVGITVDSDGKFTLEHIKSAFTC